MHVSIFFFNIAQSSTHVFETYMLQNALQKTRFDQLILTSWIDLQIFLLQIYTYDKLRNYIEKILIRVHSS